MPIPDFKAFFHHISDCCRLLPAVLQKPALMKLWLKHALKQQAAIVAILCSLIFLAPPLTSSLADAIYPPEKESLGKRLKNIFSKNTVKAASLRDKRQRQFLYACWILGSAAIVMILIIDLPRLRRLGQQRAQQQLADAEKIQQSNPALCETLRLSS